MDLNKIKEQFNYIAEKYDNQRKFFIPCFDDFYIRSVSLLKYYNNNFKNIVVSNGMVYPCKCYVLDEKNSYFNNFLENDQMLCINFLNIVY